MKMRKLRGVIFCVGVILIGIGIFQRRQEIVRDPPFLFLYVGLMLIVIGPFLVNWRDIRQDATWSSPDRAMYGIQIMMLIVGTAGMIVALPFTIRSLGKDTDKKVKVQQEDTEKKLEAQREDTKRLIAALSGNTLSPDMRGLTIGEAVAKSEEANLNLDTTEVVESLSLSEVMDYFESQGIEVTSSSDTTVAFLHPITKDTVVLKPGKIFDQTPKAGAIVKLGSRVARLRKVKE